MDIEQKSNCTIIHYDEERLDSGCVSDFRKRMFEQISKTEKKAVILNLGAVKFMDSSGVGVLIAAFKQLPSGVALLLCGACQNVWHLLRLTRVDSIFPFYPDVETAINAVELNWQTRRTR